MLKPEAMGGQRGDPRAWPEPSDPSGREGPVLRPVPPGARSRPVRRPPTESVAPRPPPARTEASVAHPAAAAAPRAEAPARGRPVPPKVEDRKARSESNER